MQSSVCLLVIHRLPLIKIKNLVQMSHFSAVVVRVIHIYGVCFTQAAQAISDLQKTPMEIGLMLPAAAAPNILKLLLEISKREVGAAHCSLNQIVRARYIKDPVIIYLKWEDIHRVVVLQLGVPKRPSR